MALPSLPPWALWALAALGVGGVYLWAKPRAAEAATLPVAPTPTPTPGHVTTTPAHVTPAPPPHPIPAPPPGTPESGSQFAARIMSMSGAARETQIRNAILGGNIPSVLNSFVSVTTSAGGHTGTFYVSPDYLGVGNNSDWIRTPMYPLTAQQIADTRGDLLPTKHMVDLIHQQAPLKIGFTAKTPTATKSRDSTAFYKESNDSINAKIAGRSGLAAGQKKDIVVGSLLARSPGKVIIYGAWDAEGTRIQPYSNVHSSTYVDYSHGARMIKSTMVVDGRSMRVQDVLADPVLSALLSDEGPVMSGLRYQS